MRALQDRILTNGQVLTSQILKVDSFLNHQVDPQLTMEIGAAFAERFQAEDITKVLTIEASGIHFALATAVALGMLPKLAALATVIPSAVLGGAMVAMFGMVVSYGINILSTVDFKQNDNLLIVACSIAVGLGSSAVPQMFDRLPDVAKMFTQSGIVTGSITAVVLNLFLNSKRAAKKATVTVGSSATATTR